MEFIAPIPFQEAIDKLGEQSVVGSTFSSSEWADVPVELRDNAFFSSRVESARVLQRAKDSLGDFLTASRTTLDDGQTVLTTGSRAAFVSQIQDFLAGEGVVRSKGGLTDITSERRLGLIFDVKSRQAQDFGYWKQGMDPSVLNEFPAQRFIRIRDVKTEREAHIPFQDQVYLKTDPIWSRVINKDFGVPWGPWGWGCGHDVEDVDRDESDKLHLTRPGQVLTAHPRSLNNNLQASIRNLDPELVEKLKKEFGDRVTIDGDMMRWGTAVPTPIPMPAPAVSRSNPVSDALTVRVASTLKTEVQAALKAIDEVHDDGTLPTIPVVATRQQCLGLMRYNRSVDGSAAQDIGVRADGNWPALTTAHEVGHLLDLEAIGTKGSFATVVGNSDMRRVLEVARSTGAIQNLQARLATSQSLELQRQYRYFLKPEEIWARAYAQFIAERSTSPLMKKQLAAAVATHRDRQWTTEDFAPIADAIEAMFKKFNWM